MNTVRILSGGHIYCHELSDVLAKTEGGTGHVGVISVRQPILEKYVRLAALRHSSSQLRSSCIVTHIEEDRDWVYCQYSDADGAHKRVRSKFLVGCDGKTGFTRKSYLEPKGVLMEQISS
jgi:2-polyprenyl-6-methoxyphenol hydroxylase-like FAD-dependent oxidoreductase